MQLGKDAILADRCGLSGGLVGEGGLHLPDCKAVQPTKMVYIILHVVQFDRVYGDSLQTDFTAEYRANLFVGTLHQQTTCRGAMASIHSRLLSTSKHYLSV